MADRDRTAAIQRRRPMCKGVLLELAAYAFVIVGSMVIFAFFPGLTPQQLTLIILIGLVALLIFNTLRRRMKKE
jgi:hypothetical protein